MVEVISYLSLSVLKFCFVYKDFGNFFYGCNINIFEDFCIDNECNFLRGESKKLYRIVNLFVSG